MLYNKDAIQNRKEVDKTESDYINLYCEIKKFTELPYDYLSGLSVWLNKITRAKTILGRLERFSHGLGRLLPHEEMQKGKFKREFKGFRFAGEVALHKTGHCLELNNFLYSTMSHVFPEIETPTILLAKNPRGYSRKYGGGGYGIHSFVQVKIDGDEYLADVVAGSVRKKQSLECSCSVELDKSEYFAFILSDLAEDLGLNHEMEDKAIELLNVSSVLDLNQYPRFFTAAAIRYNQAMKNWENEKRRTEFLGKMEQNLEAGILSAPNILDTWKTAGDFMFDSYEDREIALQHYREAVTKPTKDRDLTRSLYFKLIKLGEKDLARTLRQTNYQHLVR